MTKIGMLDGSPPPDFSAISSRRERGLDLVKQSHRGFLVIRDRRALGGVAGEQVLERAAVVLDVGVCLAEREIELHAVGLRQAFGLRRERFHGGKMRIAGREFL